MLMVLQLPIADLRPFLGSDGARRVGPLWKLGFDARRRGFLKGIGALHRRSDSGRGLLDDWSCAALYVEARRTFRPTFIGTPSNGFPRSERLFGKTLAIQRLFRRVINDGGPTWQVQFGIQLSLDFPRTREELDALVSDFMDLSITVAKGMPAPLIHQARNVVDLIRMSTTPRDGKQPAARTMKCGAGMIYIETQGRTGKDDMDPGLCLESKSTISESTGGQGEVLAHSGRWHAQREDECVLVWQESSTVTAQLRSSCRTNFLCEHANLEVLKLILRSADAFDAPTPELERYIARQHKIMGRAEWMGNDQQVLRNLLSVYRDLTNAEIIQITAVLDERRQTLQRAVDLVASVSRSCGHIYISGVSTVNANFGGPNYGVVNLGTISAAIAINNNIDNNALRGAVDSVITEANALANQARGVNPALEKRVGELAQRFVDEASSKEPSKSTLSATKDGLIEAAEAIAGIAGPITTAVSAVLKILCI